MTTPLQHLQQPQAHTGDLEVLRRARSEIMRIADPEDPYVFVLIELFGPQQCADFLTGRKTLHQETLAEKLNQGGRTPTTVTAGLIEAVEHRIVRWKKRREGITAEQDARFAQACQAWLCIPEDPDWPSAFDDLGEKAPYGIWGRGDRAQLAALRVEKSVAVVGSRDVTAYGNSATAHLVGDLAAAGTTIVSGGAFGIDAAAHRAALATSTAQLSTLAFMACGVDRFYPRQNEQLLRGIMQAGLILSEVPLGQAPTRYRFLQRNRLIAALATATVVVEARWRSGALNTAHHALELGREVYAVPGPIFSPSSEGCHRLIRDGLAQLITDARQLNLQARHFSQEPEVSLFDAAGQRQHLLDSLTEVQHRVWDALPLRTYAPVDNINGICGLPVRDLLLSLAQLKTLGLAETTGNGWRKSQHSPGPSSSVKA